MPNHIMNLLTSSPKVLERLSGKNGLVDFDNLIPHPKSLEEIGEYHSGHMIWAEIALKGLPPKPNHDPSKAVKEQRWGDAADVLHYANMVNVLTNTSEKNKRPIDWDDKDFEILISLMRAFKETRYNHLNDWCNEHWGTKWNAYEIEKIDENSVKFKTAWAPPIKVYEALAQEFPTETMKFEWSDEDQYNNCGSVTIGNSSFNGGLVTDDSDEAKKLYHKLWGEE